jgi:hypothetical protein
MKTVWKQDHIDSLQRRLDRISKQLMDGMSMEQLEEINRRLREMAVENTPLEANRSQEIDQLRRDFNSAIEEIKANVEEEQTPGAWLVLYATSPSVLFPYSGIFGSLNVFLDVSGVLRH